MQFGFSKLRMGDGLSLASMAGSPSSPTVIPTGLVYTVQTSDTFALPLVVSGTYNMSVDWGDGSSDTITVWNQAEKTHTYAAPGTYTITIRGTCTAHVFNNGGDKAKVRTVLNMVCDGLTSINWHGCTGLTDVLPGCRIAPSVTNLTSLFLLCTGLVNIPRGLFHNNANATNFTSSFRGCSSLASIPRRLFDNNTIATTFVDTFQSCSVINGIPQGLFDTNVAATNFSGCFAADPLIPSIPEDLFANNPLVTNFGSCFAYCSGLSEIPANLFANNPAVTTFQSLLQEANGITTVPATLFANNPLVTNFASLFVNNTGLTTIPSGLFDNCPDVTTFMEVFSGCSSLTSVPTDIFENQTGVTDYDNFITNTELSAAIIDGLLINIESTNVAVGARSISYSPVENDAHLDANRSAPGLQAINDMIADGWTRNGTYA